MPYVPSEKTNPPAQDRNIIDIIVEQLADNAAKRISNNLSFLNVYKSVFYEIVSSIYQLSAGWPVGTSLENHLAQTIYEFDAKYGYEGAFLGELNYAITRFIQLVPKILVAKGVWKDELRYWTYARTVSALIYTSTYAEKYNLGIDGVFEDIKDEYKRRVNTAYEKEQILKSGDCYDAPHYTRLVEVVNKDGSLVGHQEIMLKRPVDDRGKPAPHGDLLDCQIVVRKKKG